MRTGVRIAQRLACLASLILCIAAIGFAQNTNSGDIRGTVTDSTGFVVPALFIAGMWSGGHFVQALVSPESALFLCMFAALRRALGAGFFLAYVRRSV